MSQFYKSKTRECRARRAYEHTLDMDRRFKDEIVYSVKNSKVYNYATNVGINFEYKTDILVVPHDTVTALEQYRDGRTAILNFASYKHPGGKFLDGSMAQEESLCHASFLYNVLREFKDTYYDEIEAKESTQYQEYNNFDVDRITDISLQQLNECIKKTKNDKKKCYGEVIVFLYQNKDLVDIQKHDFILKGKEKVIAFESSNGWDDTKVIENIYVKK